MPIGPTDSDALYVVCSCEQFYCACSPGNPPKPPQIMPYDDWPLWAKAIAELKADDEQGVGDTFERIAASMGGVAFKAWAKAAGIDCGCDARKASWNVLYPYG